MTCTICTYICSLRVYFLKSQQREKGHVWLSGTCRVQGLQDTKLKSSGLIISERIEVHGNKWRIAFSGDQNQQSRCHKRKTEQKKWEALRSMGEQGLLALDKKIS